MGGHSAPNDWDTQMLYFVEKGYRVTTPTFSPAFIKG